MESGKGTQGGTYDFNVGHADTAESLWQAKSAKGDYPGALTDKVFMCWLEHRLTPAFKAKHGNEMKTLLVLGNASYHHGFDPEVGVPEADSKTYTTEMLPMKGVEEITVMRSAAGAGGGEVEFNFQAPLERSKFPEEMPDGA